MTDAPQIAFDAARWEKTQETYRRWWAGELDRPLIHLRVLDAYTPDRPEPELPCGNFLGQYGLDTPAEKIIDRLEYDLARQAFLGDAFPLISPYFGAGSAAAYLGARLEHSTETNTTWFHPPEGELRPITELRFEVDPENAWWKRTCEVGRLAAERFCPMALIAQPDIGGALDILASFRPGEALVYDLYDEPDEVERCVWELHEAWWYFYEEFSNVLGPQNPGSSCWTPLLSEKKYYMLQCDFSYMIGPEMFDRFVLPELDALSKKLDHPLYHLDGPGQIPHLDSLLGIPELRGIQWVPGDGQPKMEHWGDLLARVTGAGKKVQQFSFQWERADACLDHFEEATGALPRLALVAYIAREGIERYRPMLERYGLESTLAGA